MSAAVRLSPTSCIVFEPVSGTSYPGATRGALLTLEGSTPGTTVNCAVIPVDRIGAVIASLELVRSQLLGGE